MRSLLGPVVFLGLALALVIPRGREAKLNQASPPSPPPSEAAWLRAEVLGLPAVMYAGEDLNCLVHLENSGGESRSVRVVYADPWGAQEQRASLAPASSADLPFALRVASPVSAAAATVAVSLESDSQHPLWSGRFWFRDGRGDLTDLTSATGVLATADGEVVVLVNAYEDETQHRRWAPVKWLARQWQRRDAPVIVWTSPGLWFGADGKDAKALALPERWRFVPYDEDPLASGVKPPESVPARGAAVLLLAWGFDEAARGMPARDFARALDLAMDRLRERNPSLQIVLVTPPPSPATPGASARYAEAVRNLAREHHAQVIDLEAEATQERDWAETYRMDAEGLLTSLYPGPEGLGRIGQWFKRGLNGHNPEVAGNPANGAASAVSVPQSGTQPGSEKAIAVEFPGIVTAPLSGIPERLAGDVLVDVFLPDDAPRGTQASFYVKDKDGLWFQAPASGRLERGRRQTLRFDLDPRNGAVSPRGHDGAWNEYWASKAVRCGLQFFSGAKWRGQISIGDVRFGGARPEEGLAVRRFHCLTTASRAYELVEFSFDITGQAANPFDPDQVNVQALFTTPSGKVVTRPAFYYQGYRRFQDRDQTEQVTPAGRASWRVRYTPTEAGPHTWSIRVATGGRRLETSPQTLVVAAGDPNGFPAVSADDPRYFVTADGKDFYPIGLNIHAPFDTRSAKMLGVRVPPNRGTYAYDYYLEKMSQNGMNAMVMWMSNWWVSIEWNQKWKGFGGLVDYNLGNAWRLDHVLDTAAKRGVYINLVLENHGKTSGYVDSEWETSPYNKANGGPCESADAFYTSEEAFAAFSKRLRYIVARWGAHPNLLGFEIVSEMNLVGSSAKLRYHPSHAAWVKRVAAYLDSVDAYHRPISIQYSNDWRAMDKKVAGLPEVDYIVGDAYKQGGAIVPLMLRTASENGRYGKPTFSAEFGGDWNGTTPARLHADLHSGLWANAMTQTAGAPFFWWFDFVDRYNLYPEFRVLRDFMSGEKRLGVKMRTVEMLVSSADEKAPPTPGATRGGSAKPRGPARSQTFKAVALCGDDKASFYVYNDLYSEMMPDLRHVEKREGLSVRVPFTVVEGQCPVVEIWNTFTGERQTLAPEHVTPGSGKELVIKLPAFRIDIAGKVSVRPTRPDHASTGKADVRHD